MTNPDHILEPGGQIPVVRRADLVVVGGGPAGIAAAVAGARAGLSVVLLAIILDRITESFGRSPGTANVPRFAGLRSVMRVRRDQPAVQS